jgi:hypothetical protein
MTLTSIYVPAYDPKRRTRSFTLHLPHTGVLFFLGFIRPTFSRALALTIKLPTDAAGTGRFTSLDASRAIHLGIAGNGANCEEHRCTSGKCN